jgi:hypothetical protein
MGRTSPEQQTLNAGVMKLIPLLSSYGFSVAASNAGSSSGGRFATATFTRGKLEIGLIVRCSSELDCPNYTEGHGYAGHSELIAALQSGIEPKLVPNGPISYWAADGGDAFDALMYDLERIVLPALKHDPAEFSAALAQAHRRFQHQLKGAR